MNRYKILKGMLVNKFDKYPAIIGVIDTEDYKNTVNILDILTDFRICNVLYNIGLRLELGLARYNDSSKCLVVNNTITPDIEPFYTIDNLDLDIWYLDLTDEGSEDVQTLKEYLTNIYSDASQVDYILNKFCATEDKPNPYDVIFENLEKGQGAYKVYDYTRLPNTEDASVLVSNISANKNTSVNSIESIDTDMSEIKFDAPDYKDIASYFNTKVFIEQEVEESNDLTNHFETPTNTDIWLNHYKPHNGSLTERQNFGGGLISNNKLMFNLGTVKVNSISNEFYKYAGPDNLPTTGKNIYNTYKTKDGSSVSYTAEDITGHNENNELDIEVCPEEKKYYAKLKFLTDVGISIENNAISDEVFRSLDNTIVYSKLVEYYLRIIGEQAFDLTQVHTATTRGINLGGNNNDDLADDTISNDDGKDTDNQEIYTDYMYPFILGHFTYNATNDTQVFNQLDLKGAIGSDDENKPAFNLNEILPNRNIESGYSGTDIDVYTVCVESLRRIYVENKPELSTNNLIAYVESAVNRYRWAEAVIKLLRFGRKKPKFLYINGARRSISVPDSVTQQKVSKKIKSYYDLLNSTVTNYNPDSSKAELYNPINGSDYKIAGFLTVNFGSKELNAYAGEIKQGTPIIGAILMKEFNSGFQIQYSYIDIFTLRELFRNTSQVGNIKENNGVLTEVPNNSYSKYNAYFDDICNINSVQDIPIINLTDIKDNIKGSILSDIKKSINGIPSENTHTYSLTLPNTHDIVEFVLEEQNFSDAGCKSDIATTCAKDIINKITDLYVKKPIAQRLTGDFINKITNDLRLLSMILYLCDEAVDTSEINNQIEYHNSNKLENLSITQVNSALRGNMYYSVLDKINNIVFNYTTTLEVLNKTFKAIDSYSASNNLTNSNTNSINNSLDVNPLLLTAKYSRVFYVYGHSERDKSNDIIYVLLYLTNNPNAQIAIINYDTFKKINTGNYNLQSKNFSLNICNDKNIYTYLKTICNLTKQVKLIKKSNNQNDEKFIKLNKGIVNNILINNASEIESIYKEVISSWDNIEELKQIISKNYTR